MSTSADIRALIEDVCSRVHEASLGMKSLHAAAIHPEVMCDLLTALHRGGELARFTPGPFSELPGEPGDALVVNAHTGPVRVHVCRDVAIGNISVHGEAGWETVPMFAGEPT